MCAGDGSRQQGERHQVHKAMPHRNGGVDRFARVAVHLVKGSTGAHFETVAGMKACNTQHQAPTIRASLRPLWRAVWHHSHHVLCQQPHGGTTVCVTPFSRSRTSPASPAPATAPPPAGSTPRPCSAGCVRRPPPPAPQPPSTAAPRWGCAPGPAVGTGRVHAITWCAYTLKYSTCGCP